MPRPRTQELKPGQHTFTHTHTDTVPIPKHLPGWTCNMTGDSFRNRILHNRRCLNSKRHVNVCACVCALLTICVCVFVYVCAFVIVLLTWIAFGFSLSSFLFRVSMPHSVCVDALTRTHTDTHTRTHWLTFDCFIWHISLYKNRIEVFCFCKFKIKLFYFCNLELFFCFAFLCPCLKFIQKKKDYFSYCLTLNFVIFVICLFFFF